MSSVPAVAEPRFAVPERLDETAFANFDFGAVIVDLSGATMGTHWSVRAALPARVAPDRLETAIQRRLDGLVGEMSHWEPTSRLSQFNTAPAGSWHALPCDFAKVMQAALEIAERSDGAFSPALGRLTDIWGLGPNPISTQPDVDKVAAARAHSDWRHLEFNPRKLQLRQPGNLWLDLSGIAKGYAADAIADLVCSFGVGNVLVEIGGECVGRGIRPDGDPWWVELETPPGLTVAPLRVALHQLAVASSGNYLRGAHAIDTETGMPAFDGPFAVSVVHQSCLVADAWASAFAVLPAGNTHDLAKKLMLAVRILDQEGREWISPELARMLS